MADPRYHDLARVLVRYSVEVKPGDKVLIEVADVPSEFVAVLLQKVCDAGGLPILETRFELVQRKLLLNATKERMNLIAACELHRMKKMDCYIGVSGVFNSREMSDVPADKWELSERLWDKPVYNDHLCNRCVYVSFPTPQSAQLAGMSVEAFENFFFDVCTKVDWAKASAAMDPAVAYMKNVDRVRIIASGTDLHFSIKGIGVDKSDGHFNIPDLEIYTAPVRDSVEGTIRYNTPSTYRGFTFEDVRFRFKRGKIVEATANDTTRLNQILNSDKGARYIGEFALGCHPFITEVIDDVLFDEKIAGSLHFTPGECYEDTDNGNKSVIHWDLVLNQRPEKGGGEIWFDNVLISKDGRFVHGAFVGLNPMSLYRTLEVGPCLV